MERNQQLVANIAKIAAQKQVKPSQIALAWVLARGGDIIPIPGTKRRNYLEENAAARDVKLTRQDLSQLESICVPGTATGERYPESQMKLVNG